MTVAPEPVDDQTRAVIDRAFVEAWCAYEVDDPDPRPYVSRTIGALSSERDAALRSLADAQAQVRRMREENEALRGGLEQAAEALDSAGETMRGLDRRIHDRVKLAREHPDEFPITNDDHSVLGATLWGRGNDASANAQAARELLRSLAPSPEPEEPEPAPCRHAIYVATCDSCNFRDPEPEEST